MTSTYNKLNLYHDFLVHILVLFGNQEHIVVVTVIFFPIVEHLGSFLDLRLVLRKQVQLKDLLVLRMNEQGVVVGLRKDLPK